MHQWADGVLVAIVLTSFVLVAASRLGTCIRIVALQGVLLGLLTVAAESGGSLRTAVLLARHVAPGGIFEIGVPNPDHPTRFLGNPTHRTAWTYGALCALITAGRRQAEKGKYSLSRRDLEMDPKGLLALCLSGSASDARWVKERFPDNSWLAVEMHSGANDFSRRFHYRSGCFWRVDSVGPRAA